MNNILEYFVSIDISLFRLINSTLQNPVCDFLMPIVTNERNWLPVYIALFIWLIWKGAKKGRTVALLLAVTIIVSDQANSFWIKEFFGRLRPCHSLPGVHLLVGCGLGKSFPSSHAVNNFAAATILSYFYRKQKWVFLTIASVVSFSRIYVGVHYPADVFGGSIFGVCLVLLIIFIYNWIEKSIRKKDMLKYGHSEWSEAE